MQGSTENTLTAISKFVDLTPDIHVICSFTISEIGKCVFNTSSVELLLAQIIYFEKEMLIVQRHK